MSDDQLAHTLHELGYLELFQRSDYAAIDQLWAHPGRSAALAALALDPTQPDLARFLAAEIMFQRVPGWPANEDRPVIAAVYATALQQNLTGMANPWGLPGEPVGLVGAHVLQLGHQAMPALAALLNDPTELHYSGSQDAMLGNSYEYRVQDVAAELVADILAVRYPVHQTPADRDGELDRLRAHIRAPGSRR